MLSSVVESRSFSATEPTNRLTDRIQSGESGTATAASASSSATDASGWITRRTIVAVVVVVVLVVSGAVVAGTVGIPFDDGNKSSDDGGLFGPEDTENAELSDEDAIDVAEAYVRAANREDVEAANTYIHPDSPVGNHSSLEGTIFGEYGGQSDDPYVPKNTGDEAPVNVTLSMYEGGRHRGDFEVQFTMKPYKGSWRIWAEEQE